MGFKDIIIKDNIVYIHHHIKDEYNDHDFESSYTFKKFKKEILESYQLGINVGWTKLVSVSDEVIVTSMPRYNMLLNNKKEFDINKLFDLIDKMNSLEIYHDDLALRNIGIDPVSGKYKLIDLSSLTKNDEYKIYKNKNNIEYGENYYLKHDLEYNLKDELNNL